MLFIVFVILVIIFCFVYKIKIKWKTFLKKGFKPVRGNFGVYCYCGKQGTGKTYSVVEYLLDNKKDISVFCNVKGIKGIIYIHFTGFTELIKIKKIIDFNYSTTQELYDYVYSLDFKDRTQSIVDLIEDYKQNKKQLIICYDEIFTELQKKSQLNKEVIDFLCQMRKRKIIFLTTAQEWAEIPLSFRRFCRYEIDTHMYNFGFIGILLKNFKDAENMKWSNDDQEFVAPLVSNTITKCRKYISESYDTFLRISSASPATATSERDSIPILLETEKSDKEIDEVYLPRFGGVGS